MAMGGCTIPRLQVRLPSETAQSLSLHWLLLFLLLPVRCSLSLENKWSLCFTPVLLTCCPLGSVIPQGGDDACLLHVCALCCTQPCAGHRARDPEDIAE